MTERRVVFGRLAWAERVRLGEILRREVVGGVLLLIAAAVALVWANSAWRDAYFDLTQFTIGPQSWGFRLTLADWAGESPPAQFASVFAAMLAAMVVAGAVGWAFERVIVRPVYGLHLKQILITMGGMIVAEELIKVIWGPQQIALPLPSALRGSWLIAIGDGASVEIYRVLAGAIGLLVFALLAWTLNRTKVGLLIRAGVQDREMVESLGYRIRRLFVGVFVAGSALAGLGGVMWGLYQQNVTPQIGAQVNVLIFIVIIIGGLGSTLGCFVGALLVGLMANYTGFLAPKVALFSNIGLMVAILLWRPQGLYPVTNR